MITLFQYFYLETWPCPWTGIAAWAHKRSRVSSWRWLRKRRNLRPL